MGTRDTSGATQKTWKQRASKIFWGIIAVLVLVVFPLFLLLLALDSTDQEWASCDVTHAAPAKGNRFNNATWIVAIETTDCGRITYTEGLTEDTVDDIVDAFEPGEYEFKFGISSRLAADGWIPFLRPSAYDYRPGG